MRYVYGIIVTVVMMYPMPLYRPSLEEVVRARYPHVSGSTYIRMRYYCALYALDPVFVVALINAESGWRAGVVSPSRDYGIMQINYVHYRGELSRALDIDDNLRRGCAYLATALHISNNDYARACVLYNAGIYTNISRYGRWGAYAYKICVDMYRMRTICGAIF